MYKVDYSPPIISSWWGRKSSGEVEGKREKEREGKKGKKRKGTGKGREGLIFFPRERLDFLP